MCTLLQCVGTWDELRLTKRKEIIENGRTAKNVFKVGFPRDGTSRCPFVPRQKYFLVPLSLCPGTRAGAKIPGQTPLSRDVPGQNHIPKRTQKTGKGRSKTGKGCSKTGKIRSKTEKDVLKQEII